MGLKKSRREKIDALMRGDPSLEKRKQLVYSLVELADLVGVKEALRVFFGLSKDK